MVLPHESRPPSLAARRSLYVRRAVLDRAADRAQDLADLAAQEDEGDDRDDGDEGKDQRVLREALAVFVAMDEFHDLEIDGRHVDGYLLSFRLSAIGGGRQGTVQRRACQGPRHPRVAPAKRLTAGPKTAVNVRAAWLEPYG